jgi:hypothetical protein
LRRARIRRRRAAPLRRPPRGYGVTKSIRVQYDTPYVRHLPTTLEIAETVGDAYSERVVRPTFKDPYTLEIEHFHEVVTRGVVPKTTPEDFAEDLRIFAMIIAALRDAFAGT